LDVFLGLTLTGPKKASKSIILLRAIPTMTFIHFYQQFYIQYSNKLNKEKTAGRCLVDVAMMIMILLGTFVGL